MLFVLIKGVENEKVDAILDGESDYLQRIGTSFCRGVNLPFEDIDTPILFFLYEYTLRGVMKDHLYINSIPGPVFSDDVKEFLQKEGVKNIEYYQLTLIDEFSETEQELKKKGPDAERKIIEYKNYSIANVVGLVDCVDHEKSILEYFYPPEMRNPPEDMPAMDQDDSNNPFAGENPNDIDFITKLVLDESKIDPAMKVFRLYDKPGLLLFHESIVKRLTEEGATGFVFVPVDEYTDLIPDDDKPAAAEQAPPKDVYKVLNGKEYTREEWRTFNMNLQKSE
jgi:hypothetical protein